MFGELLFSFDSLKLGISYKVKNTVRIQHGFQLLLDRQIFAVCVQFDIHTADLQINLPICGKVIALGQKVANERRIGRFPFRKMVISKRDARFL